jgi:outer membrane protein
MKPFQSYIAVLCALLVATPQIYAQQNSGQENSGPQLDTERPHWYSGITQPYQPRYVPPVNVSNSSRLDSLLRAGNLYLSLSDAIALALENNLDVEIERYGDLGERELRLSGHGRTGSIGAGCKL